MSRINNTNYTVRLSLGRRMVLGALLALLMLAVFLSTAKESPTAWSTFWMIRPMVVMAFTGATGGLCNYILICFRSLVGFSKMKAMALSAVVSILLLFMGFAIGLNGTIVQ